MDDSLHCLPKGWTVEIKSRKSGASAGDKYKCYIAPTGLKFYSQRKVSDYLKIENLSNTSRLNKRSVAMPTTQAIVEWKEDTDEGLPPGWTKTIKCKKKGAKIRRDPYYTDPVTGYVFRSRKDVFRYLDTGEIGRHAIKPKKGGINDLEVDEKKSLPTAAKRQKVEGNTTKKCLFTGQSSNLSETVTDEKILEPSVTKEIIPVLKHASVQSVESAGLSSLASPESDHSKKMPGRELRSTERLVTALPAPVASSEKQEWQVEEGKEKSGNKKAEPKSSKNKDKKDLSFPRRASKRLAGIKADSMPVLDIGRRKSQVATVVEANPVTIEKTSYFNHQVPEQVDQLGSALETKSTVSANESGKVPSKCENEGENSLQIDGDTLVMEEQTKKCEAASGNLRTTEKANEKPESPFISPFGDSWPDPCLEFAFKTLTGAIPVEDNLVIEDYFQQQLGSVHTQNPSDLAMPDSRADEFCQASDLFRFDPMEMEKRFDPMEMEKLSPSPQLQKNPVLSGPGNANMTSFGGNNVLQQPSQNGTNSRDR